MFLLQLFIVQCDRKKATIVLLSQNATYSLHNYTTGAEIKEREGEKGKQTIADIEDEYALKTRRCDQTLWHVNIRHPRLSFSRQGIKTNHPSSLFSLSLPLYHSNTNTYTRAQQCVRGRMNFPLKSCWAYTASSESRNTEKKRFE